MDLGSRQPSIIVGQPNGSTATGTGDFYAPVVVMQGTQATVVDMTNDSIRETCRTLLAHANSIDVACPDSHLQTDSSTRRHVSHYRYRLLVSAAQYNALTPAGLHAKYYKGSLKFATTVLGNPFRTSLGTYCSWATMLAPRISTVSPGFFLLGSLKGNLAVCQPSITPGGPHTTLVTYEANSVPPSERLIKLDLSAFFFVPYKTPDFGIRLVSLEDPLIRTSNIRFGLMWMIRRTGDTCLALFSNLIWTPRAVMGEHGQVGVTYVAWFECTQESIYSFCKFWCPDSKATYECGDQEITIHLENLYVMDNGKKLVGTLSLGSESLTASIISPELISSMTALRFELHSSRRRDPSVMFMTNPTVYLGWSQEDPTVPVTVYASYDLIFKDGRHVFYLDLRYSTTLDRCFLVSGCQGEFRFHTAMTVWRPNCPLRFTLISPVIDLQVTRGTPIARLYLIHNTDGDIYQQNEYTTIRMVKNGETTQMYVGDLRLPTQNFVVYDDL